MSAEQTAMLQMLMAEIAELKKQQAAQTVAMSRVVKKGVKAPPLPSKLEVAEKMMSKLLDEEQQEEVNTLKAEVKYLKDQYKLKNSKHYKSKGLKDVGKGVLKVMYKKKEKQLRKMYRVCKVNQHLKVVSHKKVVSVEQDEMKLLRELMTKYMARM